MPKRTALSHIGAMLRCLSLCALLLSACAGRPPGPPLPEGVAPEDQAIYEQALEAFDDAEFGEARAGFETLLDTELKGLATFYLARIDEDAKALLALGRRAEEGALKRAATLHGSLINARAGACKHVNARVGGLIDALEDDELELARLALAYCAKGAEAVDAWLAIEGHATEAAAAIAAAAPTLTLAEATSALEQDEENPLLVPVARRMAELAQAAGEDALLAKALAALPDDDPLRAEASERLARATIGVLLPLSGRSKLLGKQLAATVEALTRSKGLRLTVRDAGTPSKARAAIEALRGEAFGLVGLFDQSTASAATKAAAKGKAPLVMLTLSAVAVQAEAPTWRAMHTPLLVARTIAGAALARKVKRFAILRPEGSYGEAVSGWFSQIWRAGGGQLVGEVTWSGKPDWAKLAKRTRALDAEALLMACDARAAAQLTTHLAAQDVWARGAKKRFAREKKVRELWFFGTPEWYAPRLLAQARRYLENVLFPVPYAAEASRGAAFAKHIKESLGRPPTAFDALLADAIDALVAAHARHVQKGSSPVASLRKIRRTGRTAGLRFDKRDALPGLIMLKVEGGAFRPAK